MCPNSGVNTSKTVCSLALVPGENRPRAPCSAVFLLLLFIGCLLVYLLNYLFVMFAQLLFATEHFLGSTTFLSFFRSLVRLFGV